MSSGTSWAHSFEKILDVAFPIPLAAYVTMATFLSNLIFTSLLALRFTSLWLERPVERGEG